MNQIFDIGKRLKEFREKTRIKMPAIAELTGIAKETLYKWEKGTKPSDVNDIIRLQAYLYEAEDEYSEHLFLKESQKPSKIWLPFDPNLTPIPKTNIKESAGTFCKLNDEPGIIVDRITAPVLGHVDGIVEVTGESMIPTFQNGCRVGVIRVNRQILHWGQYYYIIDKNYKGFVRRVCRDSEPSSIVLLSDHLDQRLYPSMSYLKEDIIGLLQIVVAIIKH